MQDTTIWLFVLTVAVGIISVLFKIVHGRIQSDILEQNRRLEIKADKDIVTDTEIRLAKELERVRAENEKMGAKLESRVDRDSANMELRLQTRIEVMEKNLLRQIELMMEMLRSH